MSIEDFRNFFAPLISYYYFIVDSLRWIFILWIYSGSQFQAISRVFWSGSKNSGECMELMNSSLIFWLIDKLFDYAVTRTALTKIDNVRVWWELRQEGVTRDEWGEKNELLNKGRKNQEVTHAVASQISADFSRVQWSRFKCQNVSSQVAFCFHIISGSDSSLFSCYFQHIG